DNVEIQFSMWRFPFFNSRALRNAAACQAEQADIIIVAPGNSSGGLAAPVTSWLEQWTGRRPPRPGALVAVFDPAAGQDHARSVVVRQLQTAARTTGMDFFSSALEPFVPIDPDRVDSPRATGHAQFPGGRWLYPSVPVTHG